MGCAINTPLRYWVRYAVIEDKIKNIDVNSIQEHIKTAQKALNLVSELTSKGAENVSSFKGPVTPRPLNKFFED